MADVIADTYNDIHEQDGFRFMVMRYSQLLCYAAVVLRATHPPYMGTSFFGIESAGFYCFFILWLAFTTTGYSLVTYRWALYSIMSCFVGGLLWLFAMDYWWALIDMEAPLLLLELLRRPARSTEWRYSLGSIIAVTWRP